MTILDFIFNRNAPNECNFSDDQCLLIVNALREYVRNKKDQKITNMATQIVRNMKAIVITDMMGY